MVAEQPLQFRELKSLIDSVQNKLQSAIDRTELKYDVLNSKVDQMFAGLLSRAHSRKDALLEVPSEVTQLSQYMEDTVDSNMFLLKAESEHSKSQSLGVDSPTLRFKMEALAWTMRAAPLLSDKSLA